jgi:hypothetical protein
MVIKLYSLTKVVVRLNWGSYFGGRFSDGITGGIALDSNGNIHALGNSYSDDFVVFNPVQNISFQPGNTRQVFVMVGFTSQGMKQIFLKLIQKGELLYSTGICKDDFANGFNVAWNGGKKNIEFNLFDCLVCSKGNQLYVLQDTNIPNFILEKPLRLFSGSYDNYIIRFQLPTLVTTGTTLLTTSPLTTTQLTTSPLTTAADPLTTAFDVVTIPSELTTEGVDVASKEEDNSTK